MAVAQLVADFPGLMPEPRTQGIVALLAEPGQVHQAQDVGALERRPVETPPLRVEDVVGHGTGAGGIICTISLSLPSKLNRSKLYLAALVRPLSMLVQLDPPGVA